MNRKIILFLLLGHTILAHAKLNEPLSLKLNRELGDVQTPYANKINNNYKFDDISSRTSTSHSMRTSLRLRLTRSGIDESRIGTISEKERTALLKKQKQIYPDKQSRGMSISEKQVGISKPENGLIQLQHFAWKLESAPSNPPIIAASLTKVAAEKNKNSNGIIENTLKQTEQTEWKQSEIPWQIGGQLALGLVLIYFARRIILRNYFEEKPRAQLALSMLTHHTQQKSECILQVKENLLLPSRVIQTSSEEESSVENELSLNTNQPHLSVEAVLPVVENWTASTSMAIPPATVNPLESNLIEISPVVRPIRNLALPLHSSHQDKIVESIEFPDTYNLLADFNPTQYESVKAFLESRNALTIEQIIEWSKCVTGSHKTSPMIHKFG